MEPILTIDNLNSFGGNMLRQGDKSQLKYRLRDVGNKNLNISGKSCQVKMYGRNYTTVVYETTTTVSSDNTVTFTINKVLPKGTFYLEFTVGDYIFPTDHREFFEITPSGKGVEANVIEIVGKDVLIREVKSQVDTELQPLVTALESAQQAETQRASAESSRVSAEAQRKTDHANRSAELASKADKVVLKNETVNGDFSTPSISHITSQFDLELVDGKLKASKSNWTYTSGSTIIIQNAYSSWDEGDKYYVKAMIKVVGDTQYPMYFGAYANQEDLPYLNANDYRELKSVSAVFSPPSKNFVLRHFLNSSEYVEIILDDFVSINLTKTFGAGNEPTKEEMDELINVIGYIDGEYALNNKELLIWTLALIRRNKNATIALGGA